MIGMARGKAKAADVLAIGKPHGRQSGKHYRDADAYRSVILKCRDTGYSRKNRCLCLSAMMNTGRMILRLKERALLHKHTTLYHLLYVSLLISNEAKFYVLYGIQYLLTPAG